jgi:hypothetical protein
LHQLHNLRPLRRRLLAVSVRHFNLRLVARVNDHADDPLAILEVRLAHQHLFAGHRHVCERGHVGGVHAQRAAENVKILRRLLVRQGEA